MRKDLGAFPAIFPMPVLIVAAYDKNGVPCAMNAAWGMISNHGQVTLFIDEDHKTTKNIRETGAFTVSIADAAHMAEADYLGIATGNKVADKFARSGLNAVKSGHVNAPIIREFPVCMECELQEIIDREDFHAVIGKVINASAEEQVLGEDGRVDASKLNALIFDQFHGNYYVAGEKVGKAWNAGKDLMK